MVFRKSPSYLWQHPPANGIPNDSYPRGCGRASGWGGLVVKVRDAKTKAGNRDIPVVHPAALRLLRTRVERQTEPTAWLFSECQPGGPDMKQSLHLQKTLGQDRDRLKLDLTAVFHTTRATFITRLEELGPHQAVRGPCD